MSPVIAFKILCTELILLLTAYGVGRLASRPPEDQRIQDLACWGLLVFGVLSILQVLVLVWVS